MHHYNETLVPVFDGYYQLLVEYFFLFTLCSYTVLKYFISISLGCWDEGRCCSHPILIIASASADASGDVSAAKYSEMSSILCLFWRVTFEVVDTLTGSSSLAGRLFEEQPHELYRKWQVYTGN